MTIFTDEDLAEAPLLSEWQIVGDPRSQPRLIGGHAFHEGTRIACEEIIILDPILRWVLTPHGAYRLAGGGTLAAQFAPYGVEKRGH